MMKKLPTYLIAGFLGSGKTTLLERLIGSGAFPREDSALIINSAGPLPLAPRALRGQAGRVATLASGCVCCASPWALLGQLKQYADDDGVARVFIEASGLANVAELRAMLRLQNETDLRATVYVVDAANPARGWNFHARNADFLLINRAADSQPERIAELRQLWPADGQRQVCLSFDETLAALEGR